VLALLAMEPPAYRGYGALHSEKLKVFKAMRPLAPRPCARAVRRLPERAGVAQDSDVETFLRGSAVYRFLALAGVPWYLRSGKCLAATVAEVLVELKRRRSTSSPIRRRINGPANYLRFRISPNSAVARWRRGSSAQARSFRRRPARTLPARRPAKRASPLRTAVGRRHGRPGRVVHTREEAIEAAWAVVDPILTDHSPAYPYPAGGLGPKRGDDLIARTEAGNNPARMPHRAPVSRRTPCAVRHLSAHGVACYPPCGLPCGAITFFNPSGAECHEKDVSHVCGGRTQPAGAHPAEELIAAIDARPRPSNGSSRTTCTSR